MAVLSRLLIGSAERLDQTDLLSIESYVSADFKMLLKTFVGETTPMILKGFDIPNPGLYIGTRNISINVADAVVYYPGSTTGPFFYGLPASSPFAVPLTPQLRLSAINYVYLTFDTFDSAQDTRSYWDPDLNAGVGGEFSMNVNTQVVMKVNANISTSTFPANTIPVCKIITNSSGITSIEDCRDMLFRLGRGGLNPDPFYNFQFRSLPSAAYKRNEPSDTITGAADPDPFQGGDKNIYTLKEWMDIVMTLLKELSGRTYWYQGITSHGPSILDIFTDTIGSTVKSKGEWINDDTVAGKIKWTEDILRIDLVDPRVYTIRSDVSGYILANEHILGIELIRDIPVNTTNTPVTWYHDTTNTDFVYIDGVVGTFENLNYGDWIKRKADGKDTYVRILKFFVNAQLTGRQATGDPVGGTTTPALAQCILVDRYYTVPVAGPAISECSKGVYANSDLLDRDRTDATDMADIVAMGGNFSWIAHRTDQINYIQDINPAILAATVDSVDQDGKRWRVVCGGAHGLQDGDFVTISCVAPIFTYTSIQVEVEDATTFTIQRDNKLGNISVTVSYAIVTTKSNNAITTTGLETTILEQSAEHGLRSDNTTWIAGTLAYNSASPTILSVRSSTTYQIACIPTAAHESFPTINTALPPNLSYQATSTQVRVNVRTEFGIMKTVQGESLDIGEPDTRNILSFIGMPSLSVTHPDYETPFNRGCLEGHQDFNCADTDSLTLRVSTLTSMMADRVQDRSMQFVGRTNIGNETSGGGQIIHATSDLTIIKHGSPNQTLFITSPLALSLNQAVIAVLDRDNSIPPTLMTESIGSPFLLEENKFIIFFRLNTTDVYAWDGTRIPSNGHINTEFTEDSQNRNISVASPCRYRLTPSTGLVTLLTDVPAQAITSVICTNNIAGSLTSKYFAISSSNINYYVWFRWNGAGADPTPFVGNGVVVDLLLGETTDAQVAAKLTSTLNTYLGGTIFSAANTPGLPTVSIQNVAQGPVQSPPSAGNTPFTVTEQVPGIAPAILISIPGSTWNNQVDISTINGLGTLILADGQAAWVRIDRSVLRIFDTVVSGNTYEAYGIGYASIHISSISSMPFDQDVFMLFYRIGDNIFQVHKAQYVDENIYEEFLDIVTGTPSTNWAMTAVAAGATVLLPPDSRDGNRSQYYLKGTGMLKVELNGQQLRLGIDYTENGSAGYESQTITMLYDLVDGDSVGFRIDGRGSVYLASPSGTGAGDLQSAYNNGRVITSLPGQPIVIGNGGAGGKLLVIQGDLQVDGIIDPIGVTLTPQGSDPLAPTDVGLWIDNATPSDPRLVLKRAALTAMRLTDGLQTQYGTSLSPLSIPRTGSLDITSPNPVAIYATSTDVGLAEHYNNNTELLNPGAGAGHGVLISSDGQWMFVQDVDSRGIVRIFASVVPGVWTLHQILHSSTWGIDSGSSLGSGIAISPDDSHLAIVDYTACGNHDLSDGYTAAATGTCFMYERSGSGMSTHWGVATGDPTDPYNENIMLKSSWDHTSSFFGYDTTGGNPLVCIALSNDTLVIGVPNTPGSSNMFSPNDGSNRGLALVFGYTGGVWGVSTANPVVNNETVTLKPAATYDSHEFGSAVDVKGDTIVVGAHGDTSDSSGMAGANTNSGALMVYKRVGGAWGITSGSAQNENFLLKLSPTYAANYVNFGNAVAITNDEKTIFSIINVPTHRCSIYEWNTDHYGLPNSMAWNENDILRDLVSAPVELNNGGNLLKVVGNDLCFRPSNFIVPIVSSLAGSIITPFVSIFRKIATIWTHQTTIGSATDILTYIGSYFPSGGDIMVFTKTDTYGSPFLFTLVKSDVDFAYPGNRILNGITGAANGQTITVGSAVNGVSLPLGHSICIVVPGTVIKLTFLDGSWYYSAASKL